MTTSVSRSTLIGIVGALAFGTLSTGCTSGVLVDENFASITDWRTAGASITFQRLGDDLRPNGTEYSFDLNGQPYVSLDPYANNGATTSSYPGMVNKKQFVPEGNYRVEFFQRSVGFAYSPRFAHAYDGSCRDGITDTTDATCVQYFFELDYHCPACTGPDCGGIQTLQTHSGIPVIPLCTSF
jgi:hypothetical protein